MEVTRSCATSYRVALSFEDGVTRFITCDREQTVADASYRQRINIPLDCRDGACGTCKALCESGEYDGGTYIEDALTAEEAAAGYVLPCSMKPRSDLVLRIAATSELAKTAAATVTGTITGLERVSPSTVSLAVETPQRDEVVFLPGQYVNIGVPGTDQTRSYSFSNAPDDKTLTFLIKLTPGGVMSDYLIRRAEVGDEVTLTGPHGSFFLRQSQQPMLLLAGGTGLAPVLSMVRALRDTGSTRRAHLVYGVTTDDDLVELDTLAELAAEVDGLTWDYCVADPDSSAPNKGFVTTLFDAEHLHGGEVAVYVCGPPPMVEAVRQRIAELGVEPAGFYYEKFTPSGTAAARSDEAESVSAVSEQAASTAEAAVDATGSGDVGAFAVASVVELGTEGRSVVGQDVFPPVPVRPSRQVVVYSAREETATARTIVGQTLWPARDGVGEGGAMPGPGGTLLPALDSRGIAGQSMFPAAEDLTPLVASPSVPSRGAEHRLQREPAAPALITPGRFAGKVVLVTGAAQGIGERTARRISAEGGTVVLADRAELVTELADELTASGCDVVAVTADLETWDGARTVVDQAVARYGRVDVAVHTVGGTIWAKPFEHYSPEEVRREIDRSLYPTLWCCRAVLPTMIEQGGGTIVNVSSVATRGIHRVPYAAAKGGVNAITSALAWEAAPHGIRVVATAPGGTEAPPRRIPRGPEPRSEQEKAWYQAVVDQTTASSLLKRYGTLDEQAAAIAFLASDEASYITATVLPVAGGDLG